MVKQVRRMEVRGLDELSPHPRQNDLFGIPKDETIQEMARMLRSDGLVSAVEITSDGTIICGHTRVAAARLLKWGEIRVWVRDELGPPNSPAVVARMIEDNLHRRQLSQLDKARCFAALRKLSAKSEKGRNGKDRRDWLAGQIDGKSGKTYERMQKILSTPLAIQQAFENRKLKQQDAIRVAAATIKQQQQIAKAISAGENPQRVVERILGARQVAAPQPKTIVAQLGRTLARLLPALEEADLQDDSFGPEKGVRELRDLARRLDAISSEIEVVHG